MMVLTPADAPLDIALVEKTVQVSSFKYLKYLLDENDKTSKIINDAVRNFDIVKQLNLLIMSSRNDSTMYLSLYYKCSLPQRRLLNSFIRDYISVDRRAT